MVFPSPAFVFMPPSSPDRRTSPVEVHQLDPTRLAAQLERFRMRCLVNVHFLGRVSTALHDCRTEANVADLRGETASLLRLVADRCGAERFPLHRVVGNHVAFISKTRKVNGPKEVHTLSDRYIRRDDLHTDLQHDVYYERATDLEEDLQNKYRTPNHPFDPRYAHFRSLNLQGSGLMDLELVTAAKEVDLMRSVAFMQSEILGRVRECMQAGAGKAPADVVKSAREIRTEVSHASVVLPFTDGAPKHVSVPVLLGCAYFEEVTDEKGIYPPVADFLDRANPRDPRAFIAGMEATHLKRVLSNVRVYQQRGGADHKNSKGEVVFETESR